jgi:hypothetical protein
MNKQQEYKLKESRINWMASAIAFGIVATLLFVLSVYFPEQTSAYEKGFQDGQANITDNLHYDYNCYLPLEYGNYTIDNEGIMHTPSGRNIQCSEVKK